MEYEAPKGGFRTFLILLVTQAVSVFGSTMTFFALTIWLSTVLYARPEQKPQLAVALSAMSLALALPSLIAAPLAGAWADRHDRRRTMLYMDAVSGVLELAAATLILSGRMQFWMLLVIMVVFAVVSQFHNSSYDTSYAMLVPREMLPRANGMMQTTYALTNVLAPALTATLIALPSLARQGNWQSGLGRALAAITNGVPLAVLIDAATFFIAAATLVFLSIPSPKRLDLASADGLVKKSIWVDVRDGALYIWRRRPLIWLLATFAVINFCSGPLGVFYPLILKFRLAADWTRRGLTFETAMATMSTIMGIGGIVGGFIISAWGGLRKKRVYGILVPGVISSVLLAAFGYTHNFMYAAVGAAVFAATGPFMNAHSQAIWQAQTPHELQGRVFAVRRVIAQCTSPLATALAGWAGARLDPGNVVVVLGLIGAAFCAAQMINPWLTRVEDKAWLDRMAAVEAGEASPVTASESD